MIDRVQQKEKRKEGRRELRKEREQKEDRESKGKEEKKDSWICFWPIIMHILYHFSKFCYYFSICPHLKLVTRYLLEYSE